MTAIVAEGAAGGVAEGTSAVRGASSSTRAAPAAAPRSAPRGAAPPPAAPPPRGRDENRQAKKAASSRERKTGARRRPPRRLRNQALSARVPGGRNYQPVILAEFLAAVLVVALAPIAKGGTDTAKAKGSPSPYDTGSLKQLLLLGVVYFILALLSSGKNLGRVSAWFGGLVLVGVGVQQTVNGGFAAVLKMFGLNVGAGLGTFPASQSLLSGASFSTGAPSVNVQDGYVPVPDATGIFPVINPSTQQSGLLPGITQGPPPGVAAPADSSTTQTTITPPPAGNGVITSAGGTLA